MVEERRCSVAIPYLQHVEQALPNDGLLELASGRTMEAQLSQTSEVCRLIGLLYAEMARQVEAGAALRRAIALDPNSGRARDALALWNRWMEAIANAKKTRKSNASFAARKAQ